jgi:hydroxymethylpyrimidine pyrophosphatase-like HAD family hydrolase
MLEWAGWSYAVRNAHRAVLAAASEVLPANDEDGVAILIDRLLNGRGPGRTDPSGNR